MKYGMSRQLNSVIRNSSRAVGTRSTFQLLDLIDMIMSRYSIVIDASGSMIDETAEG
jgi:hypothetical protein